MTVVRQFDLAIGDDPTHLVENICLLSSEMRKVHL